MGHQLCLPDLPYGKTGGALPPSQLLLLQCGRREAQGTPQDDQYHSQWQEQREHQVNVTAGSFSPYNVVRHIVCICAHSLNLVFQSAGTVYIVEHGLACITVCSIRDCGVL